MIEFKIIKRFIIKFIGLFLLLYTFPDYYSFKNTKK